MKFKEQIVEKAKKLKNKILILPESTDVRILTAIIKIIGEKICNQIITLGNIDNIMKLAKENNLILPEQLKIINPKNSSKIDNYIEQYYELRKAKGLTLDQAHEDMQNPIFFSTMMIKNNEATGMVAGAITSTADILKPAFRIIGPTQNTKVISSCFVMESSESSELSKNSQNKTGLFIFADCSIIPVPSTEELVDITLASANSCEKFLNTKPIISLLSFSTLGSANHPEITKVSDAVKILKENHPDLCVDGELQIDAAINERIAKIKSPHSPTAGKSNTLIFPNLASGNITYKAAQQFGNINAYGPFIQGLASPINDLSRGCTTEEIVVTAAATLC